MNESKEQRTPTQTEQRLGHGQGEEIVVLESGDPLEAPAEQIEWDWDSDALGAEHHCSACGAWRPVFRLEDGSRMCAACAHGDASAPRAASPSTPGSPQ